MWSCSSCWFVFLLRVVCFLYLFSVPVELDLILLIIVSFRCLVSLVSVPVFVLFRCLIFHVIILFRCLFLLVSVPVIILFWCLIFPIIVLFRCLFLLVSVPVIILFWCLVLSLFCSDASFYEGFCFVERLVPSFVWRVWLLILRHFRGAHPWVYFLFLVSLFPLLVYDFLGCCFRAALAAAALNLFPLFGIWLLFCMSLFPIFAVAML